MNFRLYDSATRQLTDFEPLVEGKVSIYHCGLTVQSAPHLGHIRKEVVFDVLRRWLAFSGYEVTIVANVTDIDDKILAKSAEAGVEWWAHAYRFENELHAAYRSLGCLPPTYEPRATGHIPEMIELIETLIERGHAYEAADGSGDVYFDVASWPAYGQLSGQKASDMEAAEDADPRGKRDPRDFALWKGFKADEPRTASWPSLWGEARRGRPGWHIECSAMAGKYLGDAFDIHGGGLDLRFPHHENELAQSSAAGRPFAKYWMHNAWVTMAGEKMSKSLGNTALVTEVTKLYNPRAVRFFLLAPHYRSMIEFSPSDEASRGSLDEATRAIERIDGFLERAGELGVAAADGAGVPDAFRIAMDNDLGTPQAVATLFNEISEGNKALAAKDAGAVAASLGRVRAMLGVLGLDPDAPEWEHLATNQSSDLTPVVDRLVTNLLEQRAAARAAKDWAAADAIRDTLAATGLKITDTPEGARWEIAAGSAAQAHEGDKN